MLKGESCTELTIELSLKYLLTFDGLDNTVLTDFSML